MTASLRALGVLIALATAVVSIAVGDPWRAEAVAIEDRALVPGFDPATAHAIAWEGGERLERGAAGWVAASGAALDRAVVDGVIAALRGGRWQRRVGDAAAAGAITARLTVDGVTLGIGRPLAGAGQTWIARGGQAFLVDDWIARALAVAPWEVRDHAPLAAVADAATVTIAVGAPVVPGAPSAVGPANPSGAPVAPVVPGAPSAVGPANPSGAPVAPVVPGAPVAVGPSNPSIAPVERVEIDLAHARRDGTWIDPAAVAVFVDQARLLALVGAAGASDIATMRGEGPTLTIAAGAVTFALYPGRCEAGSVLVGGTLVGCVDASAVDPLVAAATRLAGPLDAIRDRRPLPGGEVPTAVALGASGRVVLGKQGGVALPGDALLRPADAGAVAALLVALSAPGELVVGPAADAPSDTPPKPRDTPPKPPKPSGTSPTLPKPTATITIETAAGPIELDLIAPDLVRRDSTMIRVGAEAFAILARPIAAYVDRTLWAEDPLTISAIAIASTHRYARGAVIGEWSRDGAPAKPDPRLEAYAALLANPHAFALAAPAAPTSPLSITITVATPANQTVTHELTVGRAGTTCVGTTREAGMFGLPSAACDRP